MPTHVEGSQPFTSGIECALLSEAIFSLRLAVTSGARGVLLSGGDACSRAAVIARGLAGLDAVYAGAVDTPLEASRVRARLDAAGDAAAPTIVACVARERDVPAALRRAGRLEAVVQLKPPGLDARVAAWEQVLRACEVQDPDSVRARKLAECSPAFGLGDFRRVVYAAVAESTAAESKDAENASAVVRLWDCLENQLLHSRPEGFARLDFVRYGSNVDREEADGADAGCMWNGVGGYSDVKELMGRLVEWPVLHAETFARLGVSAPRGLLLHGPSGCGKTLLALSLLSNLRSANWLSVDGPALFSKYLGDSEARVRALFEQARQLEPCIVFLDEIDAVGGSRSGDDSAGVERRVLGALLSELDGVSPGKVFVIACTNDLSRVDAALYRSGRIDNVIEVGLPSAPHRAEILRAVSAKMVFEDSSTIEEQFSVLAKETYGFSGADLAQVCSAAAIAALQRCETAACVAWHDFYVALRAFGSKHRREVFDKDSRSLPSR